MPGMAPLAGQAAGVCCRPGDHHGRATRGVGMAGIAGGAAEIDQCDRQSGTAEAMRYVVEMANGCVATKIGLVVAHRRIHLQVAILMEGGIVMTARAVVLVTVTGYAVVVRGQETGEVTHPGVIDRC